MNNEERQLMELLDCVLDGSASDADRRRFAQLVERRHELTAEFVEQLRIHSLLQWKSDQLNLPAPVQTIVSRAARDTKKRIATKAAFRRTWAIAAVLLLTCGAGIWYLVRTSNYGRVAIAEVTGSNLVWSEDSTAVAGGHRIYAGRLELVSGSAALQFDSGVKLSLDGPASLNLDSPTLVHLTQGKVSADVPHTVNGFTIATSAASVVDRGTRFDVAARDDGGADVMVFEGAVDVQPVADHGAIRTCVHQSEAARVDARGSIVRLVEFHQSSPGEPLKDLRPLPGAIIRGAWDNLWSTKEDSHYLINDRGLAEDSRAYVDHPHQWNGITTEGMPKQLLYADYIRTFEDYRYTSDLEIYVELARPAWLYVFYDERCVVPKWLSDEFENTGLRMGLDEGPVENETPNLTLGVGPGKSIDVEFTVWRRRCEKAGIVKLGAIPKGAEARAMYGIAATPLN
jgi:hypothetical protein